MSKQYSHTDRNGTEIYYDYTCTRCGGAGHSDAWKFTGYTCYKCGGSGKQESPQIYKKYTPEYEAKLEERREKRRNKEIEKQLKGADERNKTFFKKDGFDENGNTWLVLGNNTFDIKDELKEDGARFTNLLNWHFYFETDKYPTIKINIDSIARKNVFGDYYYNDYTSVADFVKSEKSKANTADIKQSEYQFNIGDKVEIDLKLVSVFSFRNHFGDTNYIYKFVDSDKNIFIWKTSNYIKNSVTNCKVKGTVKDHAEYNNDKQTILTRCKITE